MNLILKYIVKYRKMIAFGMLIKLMGTISELMIPYVLEHIIDNVVPTNLIYKVYIWGGIMILLALLCRFLNVTANRIAVKATRDSAFEIRRDLFNRSINLSGSQLDRYGLPSLISRMTSDTYNVQNFLRALQTMGIRAPIMLFGGIIITMTMDRGLAMILCIMAPIMIVLVVAISRMGIPLYEKVQQKVDDIVRVMRENITGIRVVKALSKEEYEQKRYLGVNESLMKSDIRASVIMSLPWPVMQLFLNTGLTLVVIIGARRVNDGLTQPGVILAFLTYFNMILMGVMGLNRIFMMLSKASASAARIEAVINEQEQLYAVSEEEAAVTDSKDYIVFDHVSFNYDSSEEAHDEKLSFAGSKRQKCLDDIDFSIKKGGSLGIIGATGSGKSTIINLLMRFYDPDSGHVFVDGKDVRTYDKDTLHRMFGVVLQNDAIFADSIRENIHLGRDVSEEAMIRAAEDAMAAEFIDAYDDGFDHMSNIHGMNFSGGQKQRILISRALAADPKILILDDASSALDYRTDASLRKAISEHHSDTTMIVIAQRISSVIGMDQIIVLDEGVMIGKGTHQELLRDCPVYSEIYQSQMGEAL